MLKRNIAILMLLLVICAGCGKNSSELAQLGESALQKRDYASALQLFERATERAQSPEERDKLQSRYLHVQKLKDSKEAYDSGISRFESKDYPAAYTDLSKVASGSQYFADAQEKRNISAKRASQNALSESAKARSAGDIATAVSILRDAKRYGDPAVLPLLERCEKEHRAALMVKARNLYASSRYDEAISTLRQAKEAGSEEAGLFDSEV